MEPIPWLGSEREGATVAAGGGEAHRVSNVDAREKGQECARSGLAEPICDCDAHAVTRNPMITVFWLAAVEGVAQRGSKRGGWRLRRWFGEGQGTSRRTETEGISERMAGGGARPSAVVARKAVWRY